MELNGDAKRDPEMMIALHKESQQFIPNYCRNDYMGMEQYSVEWAEKGVLLNPRLWLTTPHSLTNGFVT